MNKLKVSIAGMLIACLGIGAINAQDNTTTKPAAKTAPKSTTSKASAKTAVAPATPGKPVQHLKKDGTPDMRYKDNKAAAGKSSAPATKAATSSKKTTTKKATQATPAQTK